MNIFLALTAAAAIAASSPAAPADSIPFANTIRIYPGDSEETVIAKAAHVVPTPRQLDALDREFIGFIHIGPNTFSRREWGTGFENPADFKLDSLNTDQWVRAMRDAGMRLVILTVKHHDGFVLWQSRYTKHGIMSSPFQNGKGDILRSLAESCKKYGLKLGVYLSPADLYQIENSEGLYGNGSPITERIIPKPVEGRPFADKRTFHVMADDYNEYFMSQLFELLTEYGPIHEVWFDGAHPKTKGGQTYNNAAWKQMIRELAPDAVIFGREDVRWCGNEAGITRPEERNVIPFKENPDTMGYFPDLMDPVLASLPQLREASYLHYQQPETDTSIREGWFYRDDTNQRTRSAEDVFDIYERSAGGNSTFLLNVPPNREGRFSDTDVKVLEETGRKIRDTYSVNLIKNGPAELLNGDTRHTYINVTEPLHFGLGGKKKVNRVMLTEPVGERGERVSDHRVDALVDGQWVTVARAANVGHKRILRFPDVTTDSLRVVVETSRLTPALSTVSAHYYKAGPPELAVTCADDGKITIAMRGNDFGWKTEGREPARPEGMVIRYTLDGSDPAESSPVYEQPITATPGTTLRTASFVNGMRGPVLSEIMTYPASALKSTERPDGLLLEFTGGKPQTVSGFSYTPSLDSRTHMNRGKILTSKDGKRFTVLQEFEFGNLVNDPSRRFIFLPRGVKTRYVKIQPLQFTGETSGTLQPSAIAIF